MVKGTKKTRALNDFLHQDIAKYVKLKTNEFQQYYKVTQALFTRLHSNMKLVDPFYKKYCGETSYAGSHFDHLRITKPDEFDINFVVNLPLNMSKDRLKPAQSDIVFEKQDSGYVELKMGEQFNNLPIRDDWETNRIAYDWADDDGYLLGSKFKDWFKKVVDKALNKLGKGGNFPVLKLKNNVYVIRRIEAGPSVQLVVEDQSRGFKMDVDLVPALKFPEERLSDLINGPIISGRKKNEKYWVVVPKPNRHNPEDDQTMSRSWRLGLQNQEKMLMFDKNLLKPTVRLMKKLRDAQGMNKIASYYIKTLFFWKIDDSSDDFWKGPPYVLFEAMVRALYNALLIGEIDNYWMVNNLIENLDESTRLGYCNKLQILLNALQPPFDIKTVVEFMLTPDELENYRRKN